MNSHKKSLIYMLLYLISLSAIPSQGGERLLYAKVTLSSLPETASTTAPELSQLTNLCSLEMEEDLLLLKTIKEQRHLLSIPVRSVTNIEHEQKHNELIIYYFSPEQQSLKSNITLSLPPTEELKTQEIQHNNEMFLEIFFTRPGTSEWAEATKKWAEAAKEILYPRLFSPLSFISTTPRKVCSNHSIIPILITSSVQLLSSSQLIKTWELFQKDYLELIPVMHHQATKVTPSDLSPLTKTIQEMMQRFPSNLLYSLPNEQHQYTLLVISDNDIQYQGQTTETIITIAKQHLKSPHIQLLFLELNADEPETIKQGKDTLFQSLLERIH